MYVFKLALIAEPSAMAESYSYADYPREPLSLRSCIVRYTRERKLTIASRPVKGLDWWTDNTTSEGKYA